MQPRVTSRKPLPLGRCHFCGGSLDDGFMSFYVGVYPAPGEPDLASSLVLACLRCTSLRPPLAKLAYCGKQIPRMPPSVDRYRHMMDELGRRARGKG